MVIGNHTLVYLSKNTIKEIIHGLLFFAEEQQQQQKGKSLV